MFSRESIVYNVVVKSICDRTRYNRLKQNLLYIHNIIIYVIYIIYIIH